MKKILLSLLSICVTFIEIYSLTLYGSGWHLISPGEIQDISTLFENQVNIKSIWTWNGNSWDVKFRENPKKIPIEWNELQELKEFKGYWVRTVGDVFIQPNWQENLNSFSQFDINEFHWFLVGTPKNLEVLSFFNNDLPKKSTIWSWKNGYWSVFTQGDDIINNQFNELVNTNFGDLRQINEFHGFWINTNPLVSIPAKYDYAQFGVSKFE